MEDDGSKSIDRDAILGQGASFVLTLAAMAGLGLLGELDLSTLPAWLAGAGVYAVTTVTGLWTTYLARKRVG